MRQQYRNGDPISLMTNGCDGCNVMTINGTLCHEIDCPDAWRDYGKECRECGCDFHAETRFREVCDDCIRDDWYEDDEQERYGDEEE